MNAHQQSAGRSFSFAISRAMGTVVVTTHGILDQGGARVLGDALLDLVDHQANLTVIVNVADLCLLDHQCLVPLAPAASAADRRGSRLTFADPSDGVEWALMLTGLAGLIAVTVTTPSRMRLPHPRPAASGAEDARLAAMAQHPAGSGRISAARTAPPSTSPPVTSPPTTAPPYTVPPTTGGTCDYPPCYP